MRREQAGERKHRIAEAYLATHEVEVGVFLVQVAKAPGDGVEGETVGQDRRNREHREETRIRQPLFVSHHRPAVGHVTIEMSGHPPFGAQIILNGHEYVARQPQAAGMAFAKVGNCFTAVTDPVGLARIADALSQDAALGRLGQVCQPWICTACLCFALDLDEQHRSGFGYGFAVYQLEYSRNLIFADGTTMQRLFDAVVDAQAVCTACPAFATAVDGWPACRGRRGRTVSRDDTSHRRSCGRNASRGRQHRPGLAPPIG